MGHSNVDLNLAVGALQSAVPRLTSLLRSVPDPGAGAVGTWSVGDVASHLASIFANYLNMITGENPDLASTTLDIGRLNSMWLESDIERDPKASSARIERSFEQLIKKARSMTDDPPIPWHAGLSFPLSTIVSLAVGEVLIHGGDIASGSDENWTVPPDEARTVLAGIIDLAPYFVDDNAARGFSARYDLRIRGGVRAMLAFEEGRLKIYPPGGRADCRISADPVAFLLVSYGRVSLWSQVVRGKMLSWGSKPWLGLKLPALLRNP